MSVGKDNYLPFDMQMEDGTPEHSEASSSFNHRRHSVPPSPKKNGRSSGEEEVNKREQEMHEQRERERKILEQQRKEEEQKKKEEKRRLIREQRERIDQHVENFSSILWGFSKFNAGVGLLNFRKQEYSWCPHLLFSVLKGRPVIIHGENEDNVRSVVRALSAFVVSKCDADETDQIIPWSCSPVTLGLLSKGLKILGLSKKKPVPNAIHKHMTLLDLERKTLASPKYRDGDLVHKILRLDHHWPDEATYLGYVHTLLLEWSIKACLYYHQCCVGFPPGDKGSATAANADGGGGGGGFDRVKDHKRIHSVGGGGAAGAKLKGSSSFSGLNSKGLPVSAELRSWTYVSVTDARTQMRKHKQNQKEQWTSVREQFWKENEIKESDQEILQYFADAIATQQLEAYEARNALAKRELAEAQLHQRTTTTATTGTRATDANASPTDTSSSSMMATHMSMSGNATTSLPPPSPPSAASSLPAVTATPPPTPTGSPGPTSAPETPEISQMSPTIPHRITKSHRGPHNVAPKTIRLDYSQVFFFKNQERQKRD